PALGDDFARDDRASLLPHARTHTERGLSGRRRFGGRGRLGRRLARLSRTRSDFRPLRRRLDTGRRYWHLGRLRGNRPDRLARQNRKPALFEVDVHTISLDL